MPKAARRTSAPRAEPYPAIKPGDKLPTPKTTAPKSAPKKALKEKTSPEVNSASAPVASKDSATKPKKATKKAATESTNKPSGSFLDIKLDGEDDNTIPIYDTCSTIRQKINALLGKDNHKPENGMPGEFDKQGNPKPYTKASFCRALDTRPDMLARFLKAKQMMGGAESSVYPKAYAFFEKKRIFEGKKKTPGREKVEADRPNGLPLRDPNHIRILVGPGENPRDFLDEYGQ
ncbi:uncharacterized protein K444DRAFT_133700 [Hyaloscypha bicolor E]|uniref:DUF7726 domain-containing protein n=1 Tax=Hyaloscypha bicolor E TaxID=1095630 RepID=A0A2J6STE2_9HELO|nr:uncharacterized protein K444DRAFT_133700 [Hyaloscypha bicolor E]PMD54012.1 hypothetical protein K444DRAFT_133700 [Hyaloscypha bicolor E]